MINNMLLFFARGIHNFYCVKFFLKKKESSINERKTFVYIITRKCFTSCGGWWLVFGVWCLVFVLVGIFLSIQFICLNGCSSECFFQIGIPFFAFVMILTRKKIDAEFAMFWPSMQREVTLSQQIQQS